MKWDHVDPVRLNVQSFVYHNKLFLFSCQLNHYKITFIKKDKKKDIKCTRKNVPWYKNIKKSVEIKKITPNENRKYMFEKKIWYI